MRANYKKLAKDYREKFLRAGATIARLYQETLRLDEALRKKDRELDEWKTKYVQMLNTYIEMQDRVERKEG